MSIEYDQYLKEHINNVEKAFNWLRDNIDIPELRYSFNWVHTELHDESKYSTEEYTAYDEYFYGSNPSYSVKQKFNKAWLHHIHNNPHHWQYWVLLEDDPSNGNDYVCIEMPYEYVIEMICDWWAFSFKAGNLKEIFSWYEKHEPTMKLHPHTKTLVEKILRAIKETLDRQEENYDNT
jgi:hypothetical protein